jgi:hypothetical protein
VVQAVNTWAHHGRPSAATRAERNMLRAVDGTIDALDQRTRATLSGVLA